MDQVFNWRSGVVAAALFLSACGGANNPANPTSAVVPASSVAVRGGQSVPVATTPAAASSPAASTPDVPASAPVHASAPAAPAAPTPVVIEIHGDDALYGAAPPMFIFNPQSEPSDTQSILRDQLSDSAITVDNLAEGGTASTVVNMIAGVDGGGPPFAQRMATSKAQIVLDGHGVEDDLNQSLGPYADALVAFVQDVLAAGKVPVLEEPGPVCDDQHPNLQNYVGVMDSIAAQYGVPIVKQYNELLAIPNYCSHLTSGLYPDDYVLAQRAQREAAVLQPIVQTLMK